MNSSTSVHVMVAKWRSQTNDKKTPDEEVRKRLKSSPVYDHLLFEALHSISLNGDLTSRRLAEEMLR